MKFEGGSIEFSTFSSVDFINSSFKNIPLYYTSFNNCRLGARSFLGNPPSSEPIFCSVDLQTIIKSESIDAEILKTYFKIYSSDLKSKIRELTTPVEFMSVFISYSFSDKAFANLLNNILSQAGVKTFLWEKDAPGGKRLDQIMSVNIKKYHKILFIASKSSITSRACQFEISEGRKKQEDTWDSIFFPIHIDDFLFKVTKSQIRPISLADEYWKNIEEIKRVNSLDFSKFKGKNPNIRAFKRSVMEKIVKVLNTCEGAALRDQ